jgi:hypothetical protein
MPDLLTLDELKELVKTNHFLNNPEDAKKLTPPEQDMLNQLQRSRHEPPKDAGFFEKMFWDGTGKRADSALASGVPVVGEVSPEDVLMLGQTLSAGKHLIGGAVKGFAHSGGGFWEGVKGALKGVLPQELERAAAGAGGETAGKAADIPLYAEQAPMSDAAYEANFGHARGAQTMAPAEASNSAKLRAPRPDGGQPTSVKPGDYPPNVSTTRNSADVAEQVTGSSRKGYADPRSFDNAEYPLDQPSGKLMDDLKRALDKKQGSSLRKPASGAPGGSKAAKFHEADQGAQELEELLNRTGRLDPLEGASNGLLPAEPAPSSMRRKPR